MPIFGLGAFLKSRTSQNTLAFLAPTSNQTARYVTAQDSEGRVHFQAGHGWRREAELRRNARHDVGVLGRDRNIRRQQDGARPSPIPPGRSRRALVDIRLFRPERSARSQPPARFAMQRVGLRAGGHGFSDQGEYGGLESGGEPDTAASAAAILKGLLSLRSLGFLAGKGLPPADRDIDEARFADCLGCNQGCPASQKRVVHRLFRGAVVLHRPPCTPRALAILAGKALQGRFYAVYDVQQAILPTAPAVGQSL